ncbi:hypothetical protein N499_0796, partial [Wolbachia pipientis wVitA]
REFSFTTVSYCSIKLYTSLCKRPILASKPASCSTFSITNTFSIYILLRV